MKAFTLPTQENSARTCRLLSQPGEPRAGAFLIMKRPNESQPRRFWKKCVPLDEKSCWPWTGTIDREGYGRITVSGSRVQAHRVSWAIVHGPIPDGLVIRHSCDNPNCVNPAHLASGTQFQNIRDRVSRCRSAKREAHGRSKLNCDQVIQIRQMERLGAGATTLARKFNVARGTIHAIIRQRTWIGIEASDFNIGREGI